MSYMFYGDYRRSENPQDFLYHFEEHLASLPDLSESRKCEHFYLHCRSGFNAEEWYENFEQNSPSVIILWSTLRKHFCVKWLGASTDLLLEISKAKPVTTTQLGAATITSREMNITTTSSAPDDTAAPTIYKTTTPECLDHVVDACHVIAPPTPIPNQPELETTTPTTTPDSSTTATTETTTVAIAVTVEPHDITRRNSRENNERAEGRENDERQENTEVDSENTVEVEEKDEVHTRTIDDSAPRHQSMVFDWATEVDISDGLSPAALIDTTVIEPIAVNHPLMSSKLTPVESNRIVPNAFVNTFGDPFPITTPNVADASTDTTPVLPNSVVNPVPILFIDRAPTECLASVTADNINPVPVDPDPGDVAPNPARSALAIRTDPDLIVPIHITPPAPVHIDPVKDTREHSCALHLWFCGRSKDSWWGFRRVEKIFNRRFRSRFWDWERGRSHFRGGYME